MRCRSRKTKGKRLTEPSTSYSAMSDANSPSSHARLKPFSEYLKEAMDDLSPGLWNWYSTYRPRRSSNASEPPSED